MIVYILYILYICGYFRSMAWSAVAAGTVCESRSRCADVCSQQYLSNCFILVSVSIDMLFRDVPVQKMLSVAL